MSVLSVPITVSYVHNPTIIPAIAAKDLTQNIPTMVHVIVVAKICVLDVTLVIKMCVFSVNKDHYLTAQASVIFVQQDAYRAMVRHVLHVFKAQF